MSDSRKISFFCEACGQAFSVPVAFAGRAATCKSCGVCVKVPTPTDSTPDTTTPPTTRRLAPLKSPPGFDRSRNSRIAAPAIEPRLDDDDAADTDAFEYGANGSIYYKEVPADSSDDDFHAGDSACDSDSHSEPQYLDPGLLGHNPPREKDAVPNPMIEAEEVLRRALDRQLKVKNDLARERELLGRQEEELAARQSEAAEAQRIRAETSAAARKARRRKRGMWIAAAIAIIYIGLCVTGRIGDWLILGPTRDAVASNQQQRQIRLANGGILEIWSSRPARHAADEPEAFLLIFCGNDQRAEGGGGAAQLAMESFGDKRVEVWAVNWPGFGGSSGAPRLDSLGEVGVEAFNSMRGVANGRPIFVGGKDIGADIALHVANECSARVAGLFLRAPAPVRELMLERYGWWNLWLVGGPVALRTPKELDAIALAETSKVPAVFVITGDDALVPASFQQRVADASTSPRKVDSVPHETHNGLNSKPVAAKTIDWLWKQGIARPSDGGLGK